jgi:hypothetical protein
MLVSKEREGKRQIIRIKAIEEKERDIYNNTTKRKLHSMYFLRPEELTETNTNDNITDRDIRMSEVAESNVAVKHCKNNRDGMEIVKEVPAVITTTNQTGRRKDIGEVTFDSFDSDTEEETRFTYTGSSTGIEIINNRRSKVKEQIHDLRSDLRRVQPSGITGNVLFWWLYPVKIVADPGT